MNFFKHKASKWIALILFIFAIILGTAFIRRLSLAHEAFRSEAVLNYKQFGIELKSLQSYLDARLSEEGSVHSESKFPMFIFTIDSLHLSKVTFERIEKNYNADSILFFYIDLPEKLNTITADHKITASERRYIEDVLSLTTKLSKAHQQALERVGYKNERDVDLKALSLNHSISKVYHDFFDYAGLTYELESYQFLRDFQGDYTDFDYAKAQKIARILYTRLVNGPPLKYSNQTALYSQTLILKTIPPDANPIYFDSSMPTKNDYTLYYYKDSGIIEFSGSNAIDDKTPYDIAVLQKRADEIAKQIHPNAKRVAPESSDTELPDTIFLYRVDIKGSPLKEDQTITIDLLPNGDIRHLRLPSAAVYTVES